MVIAVYFTNWSIYARGYTPNDLPLEQITHIIYAFFKPDPETGAIVFSDPWADVQKPMENGGAGCINELQILKSRRNPQLKIIASVGGWTYSPQLAQIFRDEAKRAQFINSAVQLVNDYNFDGIDIDWEYPENTRDSQIFVEVLQVLKNQMGLSKQLMIAAPAGPHNIEHLPLAALDRVLDFCNIMTYDFAGSWSATAAHHAQLYSTNSTEISVDSVVSAYTKQITPSKLIMGIPLYGRSFNNTQGLGHSFQGGLPGDFEEGVYDYKSLPLAGFTEKVDRQHGAAICQNENAIVSYDNASTVRAKAQYAKIKQLAGGMFWEASGDRAGQLICEFAKNYN